MIDREARATALMNKMISILPIRVRMDAETLRAMKIEAPGLEITETMEITELHYSGEAGGIMGRLDFGTRSNPAGKPSHALIVSITHLKFSRSLPFWREVDRYQKRRIKRLRIEESMS